MIKIMTLTIMNVQEAAIITQMLQRTSVIIPELSIKIQHSQAVIRAIIILLPEVITKI